MNRRVNIQEDVKRYQDTLSYASSKVDYSVGENLSMLPSDMKLKIKTGTVGYNNKILVSNVNFILGKNEKVNSLETPTIKNHNNNNNNNKKRSHTQLDSRKQVIAFQDRVITINIKEAQHPLK